uniref:Uncharacterized protein n=1 Tax=Glossina pallidipes TaxID=7398 RepID=A0A1A9ZVZ3_GLOPL
MIMGLDHWPLSIVFFRNSKLTINHKKIFIKSDAMLHALPIHSELQVLLHRVHAVPYEFECMYLHCEGQSLYNLRNCLSNPSNQVIFSLHVWLVHEYTNHNNSDMFTGEIA